jgi:hypothetical protein
MKTVWVDICNSLMAASVQQILMQNEQLCLYDGRSTANTADVALMEVSYAPGCNMDGRLTVARKIRAAVPGCRIVLLCDENSAPEMARQVVLAKKDGKIDNFVYSSVSESYLAAMLAAI